MDTVLVTGANGFIGKAVCAHFGARGWVVRAAVRNPASASQLPSCCEAHVVRDPLCVADWARPMSGVTAVVHLAGRCHRLREPSAQSLAEHRLANADLSRVVLEASLAAGVGRLVFLSSISAVGPGGAEVYTEETPCKPVGAYGVTKLEAERIVLGLGSESSLKRVILRAPAVYGAGMKGNLPRLIEMVRRGIPLPIGRVAAPRSMLYIGNLTSAIEACIRHPAAPGQVFHVADNEALTTKELVLELAALLRVHARLVTIPTSTLRLAGVLLQRQEDIRRMTQPLRVSNAKLTMLLGWLPHWTVKQGLAEALGAYHLDLGIR